MAPLSLRGRLLNIHIIYHHLSFIVSFIFLSLLYYFLTFHASSFSLRFIISDVLTFSHFTSSFFTLSPSLCHLSLYLLYSWLYSHYSAPLITYHLSYFFYFFLFLIFKPMYIFFIFSHHRLLLPPSLSPFHSKSLLPPLYPLQFPPRPLLSILSFTIFPFFILYHSSSVSFSLSSFSSFLRFFSLSLSALLRSLDINTPAYCSENWSHFALTRTSFAASSSFSFTSTGLILYSSLFPSLINCFCSTFSISITSNIFLQATSSSLIFIPVSCLFFFWFWENIYYHILFPLHFFHLFYPCIDFFQTFWFLFLFLSRFLLVLHWWFLFLPLLAAFPLFLFFPSISSTILFSVLSSLSFISSGMLFLISICAFFILISYFILDIFGSSDVPFSSFISSFILWHVFVISPILAAQNN